MRKLKTFPALGSVRMPASALVLAVHPRQPADQAPALLVQYNPDDQEMVERGYKVLHSGDQVPPGAVFVHSWRAHDADGGITALFELVDSDLPSDLPDDQARADYRLLLRDGFEYVGKVGSDRHGWKAPDDEPAGNLGYDQMVAVARLQEHGYGSVVE